ncbi:hypothetical protein Tco_0102205, partial [Tanacetum coccineum]
MKTSQGPLVDQTKYRSMIGSLMYLTASRPDLVFAVCMCARYQSAPTKKHLEAVKRVFRYLQGTINMGLRTEYQLADIFTKALQHLAKDFSFGDQFLNDKPSEADNEKTTADTEAESVVSITIQQDTSIISPMTSPVIDPVPRPDSPNVYWPLPTTTTTTAATTTTTPPLPPQPQ